MSLAFTAGRPESTRDVTRGARRLLRAEGFAVIEELPLPNGLRADLVGLATDGTLRIVEVKSCAADLRADQKWRRYLDYCDTFYFAVPATLDHEKMPAEAGVIVADAHGGMTLRAAPQTRLSPATRRVMLLRF
ncbi:MAG: MmcB family DNA repair protein, partial [Methylocystis sp.]|nr:MmcB family DNA repair protein [Methylocystis sp.]